MAEMVWDVVDGTGTVWDVEDGLVVSWTVQHGPISIEGSDGGSPTGGAGGALSGSYPNPGLNDEVVHDMVAALIEAGPNASVVYDDEEGKVTIDAGLPPASVVLYCPTLYNGNLTPADGDEMFWVEYTPNLTEPDPATNLMNWTSREAFTWSEGWATNNDPTHVLMLHDDGSWLPVLLCAVTPTGFTEVPVLGGQSIVLGCGGSPDFGSSIWTGWNIGESNQGGSIDPTQPAQLIVPVGLTADSVRIVDRSGAGDHTTLAEWIAAHSDAGPSGTERDIYRPALVMSPAAVTGFGGSMVDGESLTIAALASAIPVGSDILVWNGTNGAAPNGSYTHAGGGSFLWADRQYLDAESVGNGCVAVKGNDFVTYASNGFLSEWDIVSANGTTWGLSPAAGFAFEASLDLDQYALADDVAAKADVTDLEPLRHADQAATEAIRRTGGHGRRLTFPGDSTGRLSTPALGDVFAAGFEVRSVIRPERPAGGSRFLEFASQSDDGTGSLDCHEGALFRGDPEFDYLADAMYLFFESTQAETSGEVANRLNGLLAAQWGMELEIMVRVDFGTTTVTGWERVPYALADGATYVTSSIDGAVFRLVATVTDPGYDSIKASAFDWWIGNNFVGDWKRTVWRNGADGDLIDDVRATDIEPGDTTFTSTGGNTWTIGAGVTLTLDAEARLTVLELVDVQSLIDAAVSALLDGAPGALDTLNELAAAVNDDASFAASVTTALGLKVPATRTLAGLDLSADRTAAALRTALGLVIGTDVQAQSATLALLAALSTTSFGRSLLELANIAALRSALGQGWVKIADRTIAAGGSASESFDVTGYSVIRVMFAGSSERAATGANLIATLNANTGSVYSTDAGALTTSLLLGVVPGANTNTDRAGYVTAELHLLAGFYKGGHSVATAFVSTAAVGQAVANRGLFSTITAAVTSLELSTVSGDIAAGSRIVVMGM